MSTDLHAELAEYGRRERAERRPIDIAEIRAAVGSAAASHQGTVDNTDRSVELDADGSGGEP